MSYTLLAAGALLAAVILDALVLRTRLLRARVFWVAYAIVFVFQLIVNGVLTGCGVVRYDPHVIVGLRLAYAPVEDLAFGFALVLATLSVWTALREQTTNGADVGSCANSRHHRFGDADDGRGIRR